MYLVGQNLPTYQYSESNYKSGEGFDLNFNVEEAMNRCQSSLAEQEKIVMSHGCTIVEKNECTVLRSIETNHVNVVGSFVFLR